MTFPLRQRPAESYHERPRAFRAPRDGGVREHAGCDLYAAAGGTLVVQIPALTVILSVLLHSLGQVGIQESFYRAAVKTPTATTTVNTINVK